MNQKQQADAEVVNEKAAGALVKPTRVGALSGDPPCDPERRQSDTNHSRSDGAGRVERRAEEEPHDGAWEQGDEQSGTDLAHRAQREDSSCSADGAAVVLG